MPWLGETRVVDVDDVDLELYGDLGAVELFGGGNLELFAGDGWVSVGREG